MRLLPVARLVVLGRRRDIDAVMHPAMPAGRDRRAFGIAVVDHPAAGAAVRIGAAFVIDVAGLVLADALAVAPGVEAGAERLAVPPGEKLRPENSSSEFLVAGRRRMLTAYGVGVDGWQGLAVRTHCQAFSYPTARRSAPGCRIARRRNSPCGRSARNPATCRSRSPWRWPPRLRAGTASASGKLSMISSSSMPPMPRP